MDGFQVMRMIDAVKEADMVFTVTGCKDILTLEHFQVMKDGCVIGNVGHFDNEINKEHLYALSESCTRVRDFIDEYKMKDGRRIYLIGEGRLMNLAAGQGHPSEIMDMSFATQALGIEYMTRNYENMEPVVHRVPDEIDQHIAQIKLDSLGILIDRLSDDQIRYTTGWKEGT
jgi:adenosylhomocysteinase